MEKLIRVRNIETNPEVALLLDEYDENWEKLWYVLVRGQVELSDQAAGNGRGDFTGSLEQIAGDITATRSLGAMELVFDVQFSQEIKGTDDILRQLEQLHPAAEG